MKGRTIPLFGATPLAASRLESSFLLSSFGLDRLHILRIAISPTKIQVHLGNLSANRIEIDTFLFFFHSYFLLELFASEEESDRGYESFFDCGLTNLGSSFDSSCSATISAAASSDNTACGFPGARIKKITKY